MFDKYIEKMLEFKKINCKELVPITTLNGITSLCNLYDTLATKENGVRFFLIGYRFFLYRVIIKYLSML